MASRRPPISSAFGSTTALVRGEWPIFNALPKFLSNSLKAQMRLLAAIERVDGSFCPKKFQEVQPIDSGGERAAEAIVPGLFQVLLANE